MKNSFVFVLVLAILLGIGGPVAAQADSVRSYISAAEKAEKNNDIEDAMFQYGRAYDMHMILKSENKGITEAEAQAIVTGLTRVKEKAGKAGNDAAARKDYEKAYQSYKIACWYYETIGDKGGEYETLDAKRIFNEQMHKITLALEAEKTNDLSGAFSFYHDASQVFGGESSELQKTIAEGSKRVIEKAVKAGDAAFSKKEYEKAYDYYGTVEAYYGATNESPGPEYQKVSDRLKFLRQRMVEQSSMDENE